MESPENVESSRIRLSGNNSKLHTPCRQIGLRRKKSRTPNTSTNEINSPDIKTDVHVKQTEHTPKASIFVRTSDSAVSVDENQTQENCTLPVEETKAKEEKLSHTGVIKRRNEGESKNQCSQDINKEVEAVKKRIRQKEEKIAALKLAKLYRKKHDTNTLSTLTEKWRQGCQTALQELLSSSAAQGYQINMTQLITQLGIPFNLICYNPELEDFE